MSEGPKPRGTSIWVKLLLGCVVLIVLGIIGCVAGVALLKEPLTKAGKEFIEKAQEKGATDPVYVEALRRAGADPRVRERLGEPIVGGPPTTFNVLWDNGVHRTRVGFEITGPKGAGRVEASGRKGEGAVEMEQLRVWVGDEGFDLAAGAESGAAPVEPTPGFEPLPEATATP